MCECKLQLETQASMDIANAG